MPMTTPRRRWLAFSLRTLFVVVTVLSLPLGWLAWQAKVVRDRRLMLEWILESGGWAAGTNGRHQVSWVRQCLGDESQSLMFRLPDSADKNCQEKFRRLFPEAVLQPYEAVPATLPDMPE